jgi:hypothetical protein
MMLTGESVRKAPATPQWLVELFAHRRWIRRAGPFPHVYGRDVFVPEFYRRLAEEFERVRDSGPRRSRRSPGTARPGCR